MNKASFIGAGNVAWHLAQELESVGWTVCEVFSRYLPNAESLADRLYLANAVNKLDFSHSQADLFVVCVPDDAVAEVVGALQLPPTAALVHTSGSLPLTELDAWPGEKGVFYPLQTFSKMRRINFDQIPLLIEASTPDFENQLIRLAKKISSKVKLARSEQRKMLHIAAVLACNFTNHLLVEADELLKKSDLSLDLLEPLVKETIQKAFANGPLPSQTGPAKRNDQQVIANHLKLLENQPELATLYDLLSKMISQKAAGLH